MSSNMNSPFTELHNQIELITYRNESEMRMNQQGSFKYLNTLKQPNEIINSQRALDALNTTYKNSTSTEFCHLVSEISSMSIQYDFPSISSKLIEVLISKLERLYQEENDIITELLTESFLKITLTTIRVIFEFTKASPEFNHEFIRKDGLISLLKLIRSEIIVANYQNDSTLDLVFKSVINVFMISLKLIQCDEDLFANLLQFYNEINNESLKIMAFMTLYFARIDQKFDTEEKNESILSDLIKIIEQFKFNSTNSNCIFRATLSDEQKPTEWNLADVLNVVLTFFKNDKNKFANLVDTQTFNHLNPHTNPNIQKYLNQLNKLIENTVNSCYKSKKHIMISYHEADIVWCRTIKSELETLEFKVHMNDVDIITEEDNNLDSMAKSIEDCLCFLMCVSDLYQECTQGRAEAEYAFSQGKPIIPLIMQKDYKASGWLGIIMGTKIFVNFTKYEYEECIRRLLNEINPVLELENVDLVKKDEPKKTAIKIDQPDGNLTSLFDDTLQWSAEDLDDWLADKPVSEFARRSLKNCTGNLLHEMVLIKREAPEFFYSFLAGKMKSFRLKDILELAFELEILFN